MTLLCTRLEQFGLSVEKILADTGFSSGENYFVLNEWNLDAYIPMYQMRKHTVEPVFGTLQQNYGLRWINTRGKDCANKLMLMCSAALNLKKWMKNELNRIKIDLLKHIFPMGTTIDFQVFPLGNI